MSEQTHDVIRKEFKKLLREDHPDDFDKIPLVELGIDSLEFYETLMILEDEHGIVIPDTELHSSITLEEILAMVP